MGTVDRLAVLRSERVQPLLDRYGAWTRWSAGDRLIALFDSVARAVECACDVQKALEAANDGVPDDEQVRMRIGISFGDVIFEPDDVAGESVNIAARLEGLCEPGGLAISGSAYREVQHKVPLAYEDLGLQRLKNLADPVRVYIVRAEDVRREDIAKRTVGTRLRGRWRRLLQSSWAITMVVVVLFGVGATLLLNQDAVRDLLEPEGKLDEKTVAVLPFENLTNDPSQDHIARGIATDLVIDLSSIETASVVARTSSFRYVERPIDLRVVARLLGARYIVDGTVLRVAGRIRVNILLIDAQTERQLWASRFDGTTSDLFKFQEVIAAKVREELKIKIAEAERPKSKVRKDFAVTDVFYAAREAYYKDDPSSLATARRLFHQALEDDPEFSEAYAYLAAIYWAGFDEDLARSLGLDEQQTLSLAWRNLAESLKAPLPLSYQVQARMLAWEGDYQGAQESAEKAIELDPNDPVGNLTMAIVLTYKGQMQKALGYLERASKSDPLNLADYLFWSGLAHYLLNDYQSAAQSLMTSVEMNPNDDWAHLVLAATFGQQGRTEEAKQKIDIAQTLRQNADVPRYSLRYVRYWSFQHEENMLHLCEGLAKAGLTGRCE